MARRLAPITTLRLTLRALRSDDLPAVFRILSCPVTTRDVSWRQATRDEAAGWLARRMRDEAAHGFSMWAMEAAGGEIVGLCGFFASAGEALELGYVVHHLHQQCGFATEAAGAAVKAADRAGYPVYATIRANNIPSMKVSERAGLRRTAEAVRERPDLIVFRLRVVAGAGR